MILLKIIKKKKVNLGLFVAFVLGGLIKNTQEGWLNA